MKIQKTALLILNGMLSTSLFLSCMNREAKNELALLHRWYGHEEGVKQAIAQAEKTKKAKTLTLDNEGGLQATFLPYHRKVVLFGPGFEKIEVSFDYFLQQISVPKNNQQQNAKKRRCIVQ